MKDCVRTPKQISLHIVDHCNLKCDNCAAFCSYRPKREYQPEEYFPTIDKLIPFMKLDRINLSGGEPFLHSDIFAFITKMLERYPGIELRILTNGFWIQHKKIVQQLPKIKPTKILVTEYDEITSKVGGVLEFERLCEEAKKVYRHITYRQRFSKFFNITIQEEEKKQILWCCFQGYLQVLPNGIVQRCTAGYGFGTKFQVSDEIKEDLMYDLNLRPQKDEFMNWLTTPRSACYYCERPRV